MNEKLPDRPSTPFQFMTMDVAVPFTQKKAPFFVVALTGIAILSVVGASYWIHQYNKES